MYKIIGLALVAMGLSTNSIASTEQQTIAGYTVQCYSSGDLSAAQEFPGNKPTNFCSKSAFDTLMRAAKASNVNFAGDLKVVKYSPSKFSRESFNDYALVVLVDDKEKRIIPSDYVYAIGAVNNDGSKSKNKLGDLYSSKKSFMFSFEGSDWTKSTDLMAYAGGGMSFSYEKPDILSGAFLGYNSNRKPVFIPHADIETTYSIKGQKYPERDGEFRNLIMDHRNKAAVLSQYR